MATPGVVQTFSKISPILSLTNRSKIASTYGKEKCSGVTCPAVILKHREQQQEKESNSMKCMVSRALRPQDEEKILPLVAEEQARVQMLSEQGVIEVRYSSADRVHVWLVVQRESQNQVQKDLESMPIYPSMEGVITPFNEIEPGTSQLGHPPR